IPAYNESANISGTLAEVADYLSSKTFRSEVIVSDDGSWDDTVDKALTFAPRIKDLHAIRTSPNRGKGHAVRKAMLEARGKYRLFMDADNSTSVKEFDKFLPLLEEGFGVVIGSRRMIGSKVTLREPSARIFLGQIYIFLANVLLGCGVMDVNCGFKAFSSEAAERLFPAQRMDGWSMDAELLFLAGKYGIAVREVPVEWAHKSATSKVRPIRAGIQSFSALMKIRRNDLSRMYS
ncbi:MAG: glycosyltransferase family 2 protein, partial [Candidatus Omnitrophica bacterium]|nr:glycosyltransferase family 2 protein [Candidatus Omnitrophota bacterium]